LNKFLFIYENNETATTELAKLVAKEEKPLQVSWVGVTAKYKQFSSNIRGSYELERKLYYYNLSANYTITPLAWVELGYFRENNPLHPGTRMGLKLSLHTIMVWAAILMWRFLMGKSGAEIKRKNRSIPNWPQFMRRDIFLTIGENNLVAVSGRRSVMWEKNYQVYRLRMPVRYHNYHGLLSLGHINQGKKINMHFTNRVRGYRSPKSVGTGILYNTPLFDACLDLAFMEEGVEPVFEVVGKGL
jgi:hypothetical protein